MLLRTVGRLASGFASLIAVCLVIPGAGNAASFSSLKTQPASQAYESLVTKVQLRPNGVKRKLRKAGYSNISIVDRRPPGFTVNACKNNKRFVLHVHRRGRIVEREHVGSCAVAGGRGRGLTPPQVRRELRGKGFEEIRFLDRDLPVYVATACKGRARYRLRMDRWAVIKKQKRVGRCGSNLNSPEDTPPPRNNLPRNPHLNSPEDVPLPRDTRPRQPRRADGKSLPQIRRMLRQRGFDEIRYTDRKLPVYVATACKNNRRFRLRLNRHGTIKKQDRIGRCNVVEQVRPRRPVQPRRADVEKRPPEVRQLLRDRGFDRIIFTDRRLPTYVVRACKNNRRMELRIDGAGWIRGRQRLGRCKAVNAGMKPPQVRRVLRTRGFSRILFTDSKLPVYVVEACRRDRKFELRLNRFAKVKRKTDIGRCQTKHLNRGLKPREVSDVLRRRGYREIDFFDRSLPGYGATACRRGQKFRMRLNRFAEIKNRRRTGFCRPPVNVPEPVDDNYDEVDEAEIDGTGEVDPETCQTYLDALVRRNRIHFDVASAALRRGSYGLLRRLSRVMGRCRDSRIEISGHTDSDGSRDYNRALSRRRAKTVAGFLAQEGISLRRMTAYGYGEDQPLMRYERTERDKARNRRIDFTVIWGDDDF